ncbi:MAG: hypothetical protein JSV85_02270 [Candidatus Bathyarchaeota archaeon]|nr:MAG: hypothetical protein JSV85_02270 [Candidatus Bathyarchaeota archaeon]
MFRVPYGSSVLTFMVGASFFGLLLVVALASSSHAEGESFLWRKPLVGSLFGLVCTFGILAVFFPKQCSAVLSSGKKGKHENRDVDVSAFHGTGSIVKGHHPDCRNFSDHVFRVGGRRFCAACTGLLLGGLIALVGAFLYFFVDWGVGESGIQVVFVGVIGVLSGLFQFKVKNNIVRLVVNCFFVFGALLLLVGIDGLVQSVLADLYVVALVVFWLLTRISLSQWNNWRICHTCNMESCEYRRSDKDGAKPLSSA